MVDTGLNPTGRIRFLDAAKGIGILIICWGHLDYLWSPASIWFSSFKLAVFYMVSGLLNGLRQPEHWTVVAKKRVFSLVIPYGIYSLLAIAFHLQYAARSWSSALEIIKGDFLQAVTLRGISTLWFLPSLYFGELLFAVAKVWKQSKKTTAFAIILLPFLLWGASAGFARLQPLLSGSTLATCLGYLFLTVARSFVAFWFLWVGFLLRNYFFRRKPIKLWISLCALAVNFLLSLPNADVDLNFFYFGKYPPLFFLNGVLGSVALLRLLQRLENHRKLAISTFCGKHALFIMATHLPWFISLRIQRYGMGIFTFENVTLNYYVMCLLCLGAMMLLEWLLILAKQWCKAPLLHRREAPPFLKQTLKYL